jgi:hypothetical protein
MAFSFLTYGTVKQQFKTAPVPLEQAQKYHGVV